MNEIINRLLDANRNYAAVGAYCGDVSAERRKENESGQKPYAVVITCSDSRVVPEAIFSAGLGELFVIRTAGNVMGDSELASLEYAVEHLGTPTVVVLGHTGCGAVHAALTGGGQGFVSFITDDILAAIGMERDEEKACCLNVRYGVDRLKQAFSAHPEVGTAVVEGAVYDILSGEVRWLDETDE